MLVNFSLANLIGNYRSPAVISNSACCLHFSCPFHPLITNKFLTFPRPWRIFLPDNFLSMWEPCDKAIFCVWINLFSDPQLSKNIMQIKNYRETFQEADVGFLFVSNLSDLWRWAKSCTWRVRLVNCWTLIHKKAFMLFSKPMPPVPPPCKNLNAT